LYHKRTSLGSLECPINGAVLNHLLYADFTQHIIVGECINGIDIVYIDKTIYAANSEKVIEAGRISNDCGVGVKIKHDDGYTNVYCHLRSANVSSGQKVERGAQIGIMDSTEASTGDHFYILE